ncbi:MAG TPA: ATP-binding protein [Spirochaetota bacterium]|nr:ATP-binding protein [Spirochaetota bacterium]
MNFRIKSRKQRPDISSIPEIPALEKAFSKAVNLKHQIGSHKYTADTRLSEFFLGCGSYEFYHLMIDVDKGLSLFFATMFEEFLSSHYINRNKIADERLKEFLKDEAFRDYDYYDNIFKRHIGFKYSCFTDSETWITYISYGTYFIEDETGNRVVIHIPDYSIYKELSGGLSINFKIEFLGNPASGNIQEVIFDIIKKAYSYFGSEKGKRKSAINYSGISTPIEFIPWENLKIPAEVKRDINFHIVDFLSHAEKFRESGVKSSRGIIIYGPPGNGKTMLAKILCTNLDVPFYLVKPEDYRDTYLQSRVDDIYKSASRNAPAIVLIEDADIFLQKRTFNANSDKLSDFLNIIDGIRENNGIITILTCNNPELLDEAVKNRPKRFDVIIEFPNPAMEQRKEILQDRLDSHLDAEGIYLIDEAAEKFEGFSGAHLCEFAERLIMSKIYSNKEFIDAEIFESEIVKFGFSPSKKKGNIGIR